MSRDHFDDEQSSIQRVKEAINSFQGLLEVSVNREKVGTASPIPYKFLVVRQGVFWRTKELADGAVQAIEAQNWLSASILARSMMETVCLQVELFRVTQRAGNSIPMADVEDKIRGLLTGSDGGTSSLARMAMLSRIDHIDKEVKGFRQTYDGLGECVHPDWNGTLGLFSGQNQTASAVSFGRYFRGAEVTETTTLNALKLSLFASIHFLQKQMESMDRFKSVCDAFERKTAEPQNPTGIF